MSADLAEVEFVFDFVSPYAYLAHHKLCTFLRNSGNRLKYTAVDLDALKAQAGNTGPSTREQPLKFAYARTDLQRWASLYGIPLVPPSGYGSGRLNRALPYANAAGMARAYIDAVWAEIWGQGGDMNDEGVLTRVAGRLGLHSDQLLEFADSAEASTLYSAAVASAHDRGVFGVPTILWRDQMWWGNDRLDFVATALGVGNAGADGGHFHNAHSRQSLILRNSHEAHVFEPRNMTGGL
ncbi:2-hydroxychromene-2-carboxylate isomerase [Novosphingobium hassiacum]|uniref:2-hydroxychromene-2-carboxylate isomerase n=1 Tax=Novosphingobium hassiacum TaxID=173676 RepID=A0A7W6A1J0_9SPHN|nr:2-hydroxychromene-2-carboxylate isomerase [Novosphingobium hassiacum]